MTDRPWWQTTTVYQVYPRSFADHDGDGIGDLPGIIDRLDHVVDLGFGTLWVSPFFASPQRDFGYDISDYCDVAPEYGTLADAERLVEEAHARGLRVIFDLVLNHTSDEHPWFAESKRSRDNEKADWYIWHDGRPRRRPARPGEPPTRRPNNWRAALEVRSAWQWGEERQQWYLATFLPWQPDLDWHNPEVREAMFDIVRFWLARGVDGFRLDMFHTIMKDADLTPNPVRPVAGGSEIAHLWRPDHTTNTEENFELARELRAVCDEYEPERLLLGEVFGEPDTLRRYLGGNDGRDADGLQLVFLFDFLTFRWSADRFRRRIDRYERELPEPLRPTYVLENHDRSRSISRVGGDLRKARALAVMLLTLRGVPVVYMGQEIGMTNTYIPLRDARDPIVAHYFSWVPEAVASRLPERINRDEVRTPMQWDDSPNAGFAPSGVAPWLPVGDDRDERNVASQAADDESLLELYRALLHLREDRPALHAGSSRAPRRAPRRRPRLPAPRRGRRLRRWGERSRRGPGAGELRRDTGRGARRSGFDRRAVLRSRGRPGDAPRHRPRPRRRGARARSGCRLKPGPRTGSAQLSPTTRNGRPARSGGPGARRC
ncbi:MAG: alpha-glucosidase [Acidimicrobiia bacterium]|nr:alpha-glucosidase [Acidimicrobiia bacterium]